MINQPCSAQQIQINEVPTYNTPMNQGFRPASTHANINTLDRNVSLASEIRKLILNILKTV